MRVFARLLCWKLGMHRYRITDTCDPLGWIGECVRCGRVDPLTPKDVSNTVN